MQANLQWLAELWIGYKTRLVEYVGLTNDAMHVHGSILILFVSAMILRRRPDSPWCWLIVLAAELFNEYADLKGLAPGEASIDASIHDLYNTMLWPTIIVILGRFLFPPKRKKPLPEIKQSSNFADEAADEAGK
jgi:hypothetical protein